MADTMDLRSEGKGNSASRQYQLARKAKGLCLRCDMPVKGRTMCYAHAELHNAAVLESNARSYFRKNGYDRNALKDLIELLAASKHADVRLFSDLLEDLAD